MDGLLEYLKVFDLWGKVISVGNNIKSGKDLSVGKVLITVFLHAFKDGSSYH